MNQYVAAGDLGVKRGNCGKQLTVFCPNKSNKVYNLMHDCRLPSFQQRYLLVTVQKITVLGKKQYYIFK